MRKIAAIVSLTILVTAGLSPARAGEAETIDAIVKAAAALDQAFEAQDTKAVKDLMTPDHVAVTPYYDGPQTVADQVGSLPKLKYEQTIDGKPTVAVLCSDAAARTFKAELNGSFEGKPIASKVYVSEIWVKRDGAWAEKLYQVTALKP
ncbi:MAG TPA: nuclear transport factor 2 family protein [Candidatus Dormibacteraeota bacterium]